MASSSANTHPIRNAIRGICYVYASFWWTFGCSIFGFLLLIPEPRRGRLSYMMFRLWAKGFTRLHGSRVRVEHRDRFDMTVPRLIVSNHASWIDPPALIDGVKPETRLVMKKELMKVGWVGLYGKAAGHFLLDRDDPREAKKLMERTVERVVRDNLSPLIFPEGTRTRDGKLGELKPGVFQFAIAAGIDIQPVAILGTYEMMPRGALGPRTAKEIVVRVGEVIVVGDAKGSKGRRALAAQVTEAFHALGVE